MDNWKNFALKLHNLCRVKHFDPETGFQDTLCGLGMPSHDVDNCPLRNVQFSEDNEVNMRRLKGNLAGHKVTHILSTLLTDTEYLSTFLSVNSLPEFTEWETSQMSHLIEATTVFDLVFSLKIKSDSEDGEDNNEDASLEDQKRQNRLQGAGETIKKMVEEVKEELEEIKEMKYPVLEPGIVLYPDDPSNKKLFYVLIHSSKVSVQLKDVLCLKMTQASSEEDKYSGTLVAEVEIGKYRQAREYMNKYGSYVTKLLDAGINVDFDGKGGLKMTGDYMNIMSHFEEASELGMTLGNQEFIPINNEESIDND